jgi:hypothetical protein
VPRRFRRSATSPWSLPRWKAETLFALTQAGRAERGRGADAAIFPPKFRFVCDSCAGRPPILCHGSAVHRARGGVAGCRGSTVPW